MFIQSPWKQSFLKSYKEQFICHSKVSTAVVHIILLRMCCHISAILNKEQSRRKHPMPIVQDAGVNYMRGLYWLGAVQVLSHNFKTFSKELCVQIASKQKSLSMKTTQSDYMLEETCYISWTRISTTCQPTCPCYKFQMN